MIQTLANACNGVVAWIEKHRCIKRLLGTGEDEATSASN
jgi:hypothetical protein